MTKLVLPQLRKKAYLSIILSTILVFLISVVILIFRDKQASFSLILGAAVWAVSSFLMALALFANVSPRAAGKIVIRLYITEILKLLLTIILSLLLIKMLQLKIGYFFAGYLLVQIAFWIIGFFLST